VGGFADTLISGLKCRCPRCEEGALYISRYSLNLRDKCPVCALDYTKNDAADGPAVFLIFLLGFLIIPLALVLEMLVSPPLFVHILLWGVLIFGLTIGMMKPLKSYIIALQYKHYPATWGQPDIPEKKDNHD
jgi:uncharacterized protein (DUF983 family)